MKLLATIAGAILGLAFVAFGTLYFAMTMGLMPSPPPPPEGSAPALFMGAMAPTGYMTFVKVLEILGGLLVAFPRTRNLGLLVLGPIIVNILAFHVFILKGTALIDPVLAVIVVLPLFLLWCERRAFAGLVRRPTG